MLASVVAVAKDAAFEPFKDGDTVVFFGDSITCGGTYHELIGNYYRTRFPDRKIRFVNSGVNGDNLTGAQKRIERDVVFYKPTWVLVHFGMNDIGRGFFSEPQSPQQVAGAKKCRADFEANLPAAMDKLAAAVPGVKLIGATPTVYDDTAVITNNPAANAKNWKGCNAGLKGLGDFVKATADKRCVPCVDWHKPLNDDLNRHRAAGEASYMLTSSDRVHPTAKGHAIMAWAFLTTQGVPSVVSDIILDAKSGKVVKSENAKVTDVKREKDGLTCTVHEKALPWPMPKSALEIADDFKAQERFNRETFAVKGLKKGTYVLTIDGTEVLLATSEAFAKGVELGANEKTPQYQQAAKMVKAAEPLGVQERKVRAYAWREQNNTPEVRNPLLAAQAKLYDLVQPVAQVYALRKVDCR